MNYAAYVTAAYAVFVLVLAWEFVVTRFRTARALRHARLRSARIAAQPARSANGAAS